MDFGFTHDLFHEDVLERVQDVLLLLLTVVVILISFCCWVRLVGLSSVVVPEDVVGYALVRSQHLVHHEFTSLRSVDKLNYLRLVSVNVVSSIGIHRNFALIILQAPNVDSRSTRLFAQEVGKFFKVVRQIF